MDRGGAGTSVDVETFVENLARAAEPSTVYCTEAVPGDRYGDGTPSDSCPPSYDLKLMRAGAENVIPVC